MNGYKIFFFIVILAILIPGCNKDINDEDRKKFAKAKILYNQKKKDLALQLFEELMDKPGFFNARIMAGKIYYYNKNYEIAKKYFEKALAREKCSIDSLYWLAKISNLDKKKPKETLGYIERILLLDSFHIEARILKASILKRQNKLADAMTEYSIVLHQGSKLAIVFFERGLIYKKNGLLDKAKENFEKAGILKPNDPALRKAILLALKKKNKK